MIIEVYASNKLNRLENHMKLSIYLKKEGLTQHDFALKAGVDPATVSRIINNTKYICRMSTAKQIEQHSYGQVSWFDLTSNAMDQR